MADEQRFCFGIAYPAGPQPNIQKGQDGGRDFLTAESLELAAWNFMLKGQQHGLFHVDGTTGAAQPVESSIYRNAVPWLVSDRAEVRKALAEMAADVEKMAGPDDLIVRDGDWCLGAILSPEAWDLYKSGRIGGWSPQGVARRRRRVRS